MACATWGNLNLMGLLLLMFYLELWFYWELWARARTRVREEKAAGMPLRRGFWLCRIGNPTAVLLYRLLFVRIVLLLAR